MMAVELTNMIMIRNNRNQVVMQKRTDGWSGMSFPGGHVEHGETFYDSAVREAKEETGLVVRDLQFCGMMHWFNTDNSDRYIVFLYKTENFEGELIGETEEGEVSWVDVDAVQNLPLSENFKRYLPLFMGEGYSEVYCEWNQNEQWDSETAVFVYK